MFSDYSIQLPVLQPYLETSGGHWSISPAEPIRGVRRRYREGTLVLDTEFDTDTVVDRCPPTA